MQSVILEPPEAPSAPPGGAGSVAAAGPATRCLVASLLIAALTMTPAARAHTSASEASAISLLPVAVSVAAPVMVFSAGAVLTVVAVQASAQGAVWVLERAFDGARASVHRAGHAPVAVGSVI